MIERSGKISVYCVVQVSEADIGGEGFGEAAKIKFKVSTEGGDSEANGGVGAGRDAGVFPSRPSGEIFPCNGARIAKLQLYLSQIYAADHLPCYRPAAVTRRPWRTRAGRRGRRRSPVRDEYDEHHRVVMVDGRYGGELAEGALALSLLVCGEAGLGARQRADPRLGRRERR